MIKFKSGQVPNLPFVLAIKKRLPVRCIQISEPFQVETLEGTFQGKEGDFLIVGVKGEMYPCRKDIFEETYEFADPEEPPAE
jgi:hypothetical protein